MPFKQIITENSNITANSEFTEPTATQIHGGVTKAGNQLW